MLISHTVSDGLGEGSHRSIKATGGVGWGGVGVLTLRLLPRAIQQSKLLPRLDTKSHFWRSGADR